MLELKEGSWLVNKSTGDLCRVAAITDSAYILEPAFGVETEMVRKSDLRVLYAVGSDSSFSDKTLTDDERLSYAKNVHGFDKALDLVGNVSRAWGKKLQERADIAGLRNFSREYKTAFSDALSMLRRGVEEAEWQNAVIALTELMHTAIYNSGISYIETITATPVDPAGKFAKAWASRVDENVNIDTVVNYVLQSADIQQQKAEAAHRRIDKKKKEVEMTSAPVLTSVAMHRDELGQYRSWLVSVYEALDAEGDQEDKASQLVDSLISSALSSSGFSPSAGFISRLEEVSGRDKAEVFADVMRSKDPDDIRFASDVRYYAELLSTLYADLAASRPVLGSAKKGAELTPDHFLVASVLNKISNEISLMQVLPAFKNEFKDRASNLALSPAQLIEGAQRVLDKIDNHLEGIQEYYDRQVKAQESRAQKRLSRAPLSGSLPMLRETAVMDMARATWVETSFLDDLYKVIEARTGIKQTDIDFGIKASLPESVYILKENLGDFDKDPIPVREIGMDALAWGKTAKHSEEKPEYVYMLREAGRYALHHYPANEAGVSLIEGKIFDTLDAARADMANMVQGVHMLVMRGRQEDIYESEVVDNRKFLRVRPEISTIVDNVYNQVQQVAKIRSVLSPDSDPEVSELMGKISKVLGFGHPVYLRHLNRKLAHASDMAEFVRAFYDTAEMIRTHGNPSERESPYMDKAESTRFRRTLPATPATVRKYRDSLSEIAIPSDTGFNAAISRYMEDLYDNLVMDLTDGDTVTAKARLARVDQDLKKIEEKRDKISKSLALGEFIPVPAREFWDPQDYLSRIETPHKILMNEMLGLAKSMAQHITPEQLKVSNTQNTGAEYMSNMIELNKLKQGQPVTLRGQSSIHVVVSQDEEDPFKYYLIPESSINSHDRVDLVTANLSDLSPVRVYRVDVGDILEINGSLAKVIDASSRDIGVVQLMYQGAAEPVNFSLSASGLPYENKAPYKLVTCSKDGGYITPEDEINCPFHGSEGHLANAVAGYTPKVVQACMQQVQDPEMEKKFRHEYEVACREELDKALEKVSFADFEQAKYKSVEDDFEGELEIGARVKKFGSTVYGTLLGKKKACWQVSWETGTEEACWPQELILIKETVDQ